MKREEIARDPGEMNEQEQRQPHPEPRERANRDRAEARVNRERWCVPEPQGRLFDVTNVASYDVRTNVASYTDRQDGRAPRRCSAIVGITHSSTFTCTRFASGCAPRRFAASAPRNARRRSSRLATM